jgi:hypothetical protein
MKKIAVFLIWCLLVQTQGIVYAAEYKSTIDDQKQVAITIYNNNLGLVKDVRTIKFKPGVHEVKFMDVASQIRPVTVHIKSLTSPDKLSVLEQNYEYDLLNQQKLLDKFVNKKIKIFEKNYYTGEEEVYDAELLSNNGSPIFKINGEIHLNSRGQIILPEIPENLIAKPTLIWMLQNKNVKAQDIEASYLTNGINWKADYIAVINDDNTRSDLSGWVTIDNRSGTAYKDAKIKLVAGDVNRVHDQRVGMLRRAKASPALEMDAASQFAEESFFEYHLYTLQRSSTIKDNQTKQIELLKADDIPVKQRMVYYGASHYFRNSYSGDFQSNEKVSVYLDIENKKQNNLGIPLPAGVIRAYKKDKEGSLQFIGEDRIDHTPKDEKITIKMGDAFDVVGKRKQVDYKILSRNSFQRFDTEQQWQIKLRNHKDNPVEVEVVEPIPGDWQMVTSSDKYEKTEAHTIKFKVKLEKDEEKVIDYRVKIRYW